MAIPIRTRRTNGFSIISLTGDMGCSSSTPNAQAASMKMPSPAASIRYSGQWVARAARRGSAPARRASVIVAIHSRNAGQPLNYSGIMRRHRGCRSFMATPIQKPALQSRHTFLIEQNAASLRQAIVLLEQIDDETYITSPPSLAPHRVGGHLRHILEFYECFLDGIESSHIDYDARKRDEAVETCRATALARTGSVIRRLETAAQL